MKSLKKLSAVLLTLCILLSACSGAGDSASPQSSAAGQSQATAQPSASGQTAQPSGASGEKRVLKVAQEAGPNNMTPWLIATVADINIVTQVYHSLVELDQYGNFSPYLATSWEQNEDGTVWTFKLREDIYWQTGNDLFGDEKVQVTAEDVKFTYDYTLNPDNNCRQYSNASSIIESVDVVDQFTVRFNLKANGALLLFRVCKIRIFPRKGVEEGWDFANHPVGSGAFKFKEWVMDDHVTLIKNDEYYMQPNFDEIEYLFITDPSVAAIALQNNEIDIALSLNTTDAATINGIDGFLVRDSGLGSPNFVAIKYDDPLFTDINVRKALAMAVDADGAIAAAYPPTGGIITAVRGYSPLPPDRPGHDNEGCKELTPVYDPAGAAALLESSGWVKGSDGIYAKDGTRLSFTFPVSNSRTAVERLAVVISTQLKAFGVECTVQSTEQATWHQDSTDGRAQMTVYSGYDGPAASTQLMHTDVKYNPVNGYSNPEVDALLEEAWNVTTDNAVRAEQIEEASHMFISDVPWLFVYYVYSMVGYDANLQGFDFPSLEYAVCSDSRNLSLA